MSDFCPPLITFSVEVELNENEYECRLNGSCLVIMNPCSSVPAWRVLLIIHVGSYLWSLTSSYMGVLLYPDWPGTSYVPWWLLCAWKTCTGILELSYWLFKNDMRKMIVKILVVHLCTRIKKNKMLFHFYFHSPLATFISFIFWCYQSPWKLLGFCMFCQTKPEFGLIFLILNMII